MPAAYARAMKRLTCAAALLAACGSSHDATPDAPAAQDAMSIDAAAAAHYVAYVSGYGPDIAWLDFDPAAGTLTPVGSIAARQGAPSFLATTASHLYAVSESASRAAAYTIDPATGALGFVNDVDSGGNGPAHLSVDRSGTFVLVANYGGGTAAVIPIRGDGGLAAPRQTVSPGANAHMIVTDASNHHAFVPCKGSDYIAQYNFDPATGALSPNPAATVASRAGAGPRHLAFAPDGAHAYVIDENDSTLIVFGYDATTGRLSPQQTVSTRAAGATGNNTGAEVAVHPSGKFVYGSNRGDNTLAVFAIDAATGHVTQTAQVATGGATPRQFAIDPTGRWLFVANQDSNTVVAFAIDAATGGLTRSGTGLSANQPSFIGFVAMPAR